jgi:hypothetical protein
MKPTDFIVEGIGEDADAMHKDHEVQLARQDCYNAAKNAIELHKLLSSVSEQEGLEGWISEKLTLAADYLNTVKEYYEYQRRTATHFMLPEFTFESAEAHMDSLLENDDFAPSKRAATNIAASGWRRGGERTGSLKGYVETTFDHIKSVFGDPIDGPTDKPYDKVSCEWIITFKDGTVASIYDYKTGGTPMTPYRWHIGGNNTKAVEYVTHLLGLEGEVYEGQEVFENAPALLKAEMPLVREIEQSMADNGYQKGTEEYNKVFGHMLAFHRKFGNANRINQPDPVNKFNHNPDDNWSADFERRMKVSEMTAGGTGAGGFATGPTAGGTFKKTTGVPKKVKNTLRRISPKIGTGIYK